jgi:hypothetical protein
VRERGGAASLVVCAVALGLAAVLAGWGAALDDLFHSDGQMMDGASRGRWAAGEPSPRSEKSDVAPPLPTREEVHRRMVAILGTCVWANLRRPDRDVVEILPLEEHREAWRLLVDGARSAEPGLAVPGWPPDCFLLCEVPRSEGGSAMHMLLFKDGMLGSGEPELGRMVRTIKPGPEFAEGLESLEGSAGL